MQQTSSKKPLIIIISIVILAGLAYFYFSGSPSDTSISSVNSSTGETSEASIVGAKVLSLLNEIGSLRIDSSVFDSQVFKSLVDHTVIVPEQNVGRPNPFIPVGGIPVIKTGTNKSPNTR